VKTLTHGVTRFRITLECYEGEYLSESKGRQECLPLLDGRLETRWIRLGELGSYPLSSTGRKLARWLYEVAESR
jgi:A/G-specific adenine glycosylase